MVTFLFFLPFLLFFVVIAVYGERKVSAFIQDRYGPMEVGPVGLFQTIADLLKLLQKEDIVPKAADKLFFLTAPFLIFVAIFAGYAVIPLTSGITGSTAQVGVFFLLAIISMDVLGVLMAGWGSNNKFALYGSMRSVAQLISYEVPLTLSVLAVIIVCGTLDLQDISFQQGIYIHRATDSPTELNYLFGSKLLGIDVTSMGGFLTWNILRMPLLAVAFLMFFIASLAESNRAPFDLPEAESELVGGFHTEYSGFRWSLIMLSEYGMMLLVSFLAVILFFGSWNTPLPNLGSLRFASWTTGTPGSLVANLWGTFWMLSKVLLLIFAQMWVRWTYPRLRVDQLMSLCWKYMTPISLVLIFLIVVWKLVI